MANITVLEPGTGKMSTISIGMNSAMLLREFTGTMQHFVTLSTSAKDVSGSTIPMYTITALSDGAGGTGLDRHGSSLAGGKYANLTAAVEDYVAMMVNGVEDEPWTEMAFS